MRPSIALYLVLLVLSGPIIIPPVNAAQSQGSPALSTVIQEANKEGKLKLSWGEGTLGGTKRMALYEQLMNKMFGSNVKIGPVGYGRRIVTEPAAGAMRVSCPSAHFTR